MAVARAARPTRFILDSEEQDDDFGVQHNDSTAAAEPAASAHASDAASDGLDDEGRSDGGAACSGQRAARRGSVINLLSDDEQSPEKGWPGGADAVAAECSDGGESLGPVQSGQGGRTAAQEGDSHQQVAEAVSTAVDPALQAQLAAQQRCQDYLDGKLKRNKELERLNPFSYDKWVK